MLPEHIFTIASDRPTPPGKAIISMTLGRSVTLTWTPPEDDGGCKIGNYVVEYFRVRGPASQLIAPNQLFLIILLLFRLDGICG